MLKWIFLPCKYFVFTGLGDFTPDAITALPDPCPLPLKERALRRSLNEKEKIMYAPFSGVGGIVYDQDAVYIDLGGSHSHKSRDRDTAEDTQEDTEKGTYVTELRDLKTTLDEKINSAGLKLFSASEAITGAEMTKEFSESEDEDSNEMYEKEMSKNFDSIVADDGRVRRRVIFDDEKKSKVVDTNESRVEEMDEDDDDVVQSIQKELKELKKSGPDQTDKLKSKTKQIERDESMDESDIALEDSEEDESLETNDKFITSVSKVAPAMNNSTAQDVSSIVSKLKSKLGKTSSENEENETSLQKSKVPSAEEETMSDSESENSLDEEDEEDMSELEDDEMDGEDSDAELQDVEHNNEWRAMRESENDEKAKQKRLSLAEEAFYSRFRNRSTQKMIYDDTEDYLNVTSKADFDVANCNVKERQEDVDDDSYMKALFIGGDYAETAKQFLDAENDSEEDVFGDFEELDEEGDEKQKKSGGSKKFGDEDDGKKREEMKKQLKEKFDMEYDDGGADKTFYKEWKAQVEEQTKV